MNHRLLIARAYVCVGGNRKTIKIRWPITSGEKNGSSEGRQKHTEPVVTKLKKSGEGGREGGAGGGERVLADFWNRSDSRR